MKTNQEVKKTIITLDNREKLESEKVNPQNLLRRIILSGITSLFLVILIIFILPRTVLDFSSLL